MDFRRGTPFHHDVVGPITLTRSRMFELPIYYQGPCEFKVPPSSVFPLTPTVYVVSTYTLDFF